MSEPFVFDSRCDACKTPYGAVVCGTEVTLRVRPLRREGFTHCALLARHEFSGHTEELLLTLSGTDEERIRFSVTFAAPDSPELIWYAFRLWRDDGSGCVLDRGGYHSGDTLDAWQLTVYADTPAPTWFGEGMTYQIFPDRFCRLTLPDPGGMVGDRWVHSDWNDGVHWQPDADGEIRNRDFFGGSLKGIASKLDFLVTLGVETLYLCPIFESASNHRYNTADYRKIDPMLGTEEDFRRLCDACHARGIRVVLDGVFNHTGSQSVYFNADGFYPTLGAAQSTESPWYPWYRFTNWPTDYDAWWGIKTLPAVEEGDASYQDFIISGEDSVVRHWLRCGADGWRLDVADELPDAFVADIRSAMDETKPGALLLGEVWEDGTTKVAYSQRRKYLLGHETHGLMNYPFRTAALAWLQGGDAVDFVEAMETLREHYPRPAFYSAMNFLGTHDTPRILTLLGAAHTPEAKEQRSAYRLSHEEYHRGAALVRVAAQLLFTFPGSPTVYYGDEAGMQGFEDPFNRGTYPWGQEDEALRGHFSLLGKARREHSALRRGELRWLHAQGAGLVFARGDGAQRALSVLNAGGEPLVLSLPWDGGDLRDAFTGQTVSPQDGLLALTLSPRSGMLLFPLL